MRKSKTSAYGAYNSNIPAKMINVSGMQFVLSDDNGGKLNIETKQSSGA